MEVETLSAYAFHDRATYANDDGGPKIWLNNDYTDKAWQFNQEAKLRWSWAKDSDSALGASFLSEDLDGANVFRDDMNRGTTPAFDQTIHQDTTQWGIYVTTHIDIPTISSDDASVLSWGRILDRFSIDASTRYNSAEKEFSVESFAIAGLGTFPSLIGSDKDSWAAWTGDLALAYHFTEETSIYGKLSRGWKPGHFNAGTLFSSQIVSPVDPETVDSIEVGLRSAWFGNRLTANITGLNYRYSDLQVFQLTTDSKGFVLRRLINANRAEIQGVEWELSAEPIGGLLLTFNGGYLDSAYTKFGTSFERTRFFPGAGFLTISVSEDYSGNRLIASPKWSWTGSAEYTIPFRYGSLRPRFSFSYKDDIFFDANEGTGAEGTIVEELIGQPAYWIFNAALSYTPPRWPIEITGFVHNFLDEEYKIQSFDLSNNRRLLLDVYGEPRMIGAMITLRY